MSITDRRNKEKQELTELILNSARKLFLEKGIEQTTIRSIAEAIDYSVGTVYKYYRDKNAIFHSLHSQGFKELGGRFLTLSSVQNPMERLRAMGWVYIKFALEQPDMYDLMFNAKAPFDFLEEINQDEWNEGRATFNGLKQTISECMADGYFKGHSLEPLSFLIWSVVHGMCCLEIQKRTGGVKLEKPATIVNDGYVEFLKILEKL